jgi:hypothetical protein
VRALHLGRKPEVGPTTEGKGPNHQVAGREETRSIFLLVDVFLQGISELMCSFAEDTRDNRKKQQLQREST